VRENLGAGATKAEAPMRVETVRIAAVFCSRRGGRKGRKERMRERGME
jgi:hypothetical protein